MCDSSDWERWKLIIKNFYKNSHSVLPITVNKVWDNRPYIFVKLFHRAIIGLFDSGVNRSVIGSKVLKLLKLFNLKMNPPNLKK